MSNVATLPVNSANDCHDIIERVLLLGDLSKLNSAERTEYYLKTCSSLGLNPLTRPFDYLRLNGKEVLYAKRDCADQLRKLNRISLEIVDRKISGDLLVVTVRATTPDGRTDEDMGAVSVKGLQGEALANAMLKAMTKAKRRVTLSICGLGMLDESEVRSALEADALAGPVDPKPRPGPAPGPHKTAGRPLLVVLPDGWEPAVFKWSNRGCWEALQFLTGAVCDGSPAVVAMNNQILDEIAERVPALAEEVANLRAAAAEALSDRVRPGEAGGASPVSSPADGGDAPGVFDEEERDAFGLPPELPTDPP